LSNAVLRVIVDAQLKRLVVDSVLVPDKEFEAVGADLARYGFAPRANISDGEQLSIHLRSYTGAQDEYFYNGR
jgi:hypothetical protein